MSVSESASNYIEGDLVNFNKMRRVSEIVYYIYLIKMSTKCIIVVCIIHNHLIYAQYILFSAAKRCSHDFIFTHIIFLHAVHKDNTQSLAAPEGSL